MKNNISATLSTRCRLLTFLLVFAGAFHASAQIDVDDFNTGPFSLSGIGFANDIIAPGAIGGKRDAKIANTVTNPGSPSMTLVTSGFSAGTLQVYPDNNTFPDYLFGNYDIGWGNNDVLGGTDLNLNAADYSQIEVTFTQAPFTSAQMNVRFNKPGDPDYSSSALVQLTGAKTYTFPFSSFSGLNPADIDGISIGFSNCIPDTLIIIDHIKISGFLDTDGDGIGNGSDNCPNMANSDQADIDNDGIGDVCDTCPNDPQNDADGDGVCSNIDNCPDVANASQLDSDDDGIGDACDPDDDNDGIADNVDNCPLTVNANQLNTDGDAQGNACDPDDDNDGIADNVDNCPLASNANQSDIDNNGIGDACDAKPIVIDTDNDGIRESVDNCPTTANPDQADADGDGIGDVCDPCSSAIPNLANFNTTTCQCDPGYYGIIGSLGFIKRCEPCPVGVNCSGNVNALILAPDNTNEVAGQQSQHNFIGDGQGQNKSGHMDNSNMAALEKPEWMVTPNPAVDLVRFQLGQLSGQQELSLEIYTSMGQLMLRKVFGKVSYFNEEIDISSFNSGVYFVRVKAGELRIDQQLIVSKN